MDENQGLNGLTIAPGVIETIVTLAILEVDGVATVGAKASPSGIFPSFGRKNTPPGILIYSEDDEVIVDAQVQVLYGYRLYDIAEGIRTAVANALQSQANIDVASVNVTIDGIQFAG